MNLSGLGSETEGDKQLKVADALAQPSLLSLRFKADWDQATPLYEKAALNFRQSKALTKAIAAYEKAATGQERLNSPWHAAKHLEKAGECCKDLGRLDEVSAWYLRAAECYEEAGRGQAAAEALAKGARAVEQSDAEAASDLYGKAVQALEAGGKAGMAADIYRRATGNELRRGRWAAAAQIQLRWAVACDEAQAATSQRRAYLAAIIIWLAGQNAKQAYLCYQDALTVPAFSTCDESFAAEELLNAFRSGDGEQVATLVTPNSVYYQIDNQISRLAKRLPEGDMKTMAAELEVAAAEQGRSSALQQGAISDDELDLS